MAVLPLAPKARDEATRREHQRRIFERSLHKLLNRKPFSYINVDDVLNDTGKSISSFYSAFKSGLPGAAAFWAARQLNGLADGIERRLRTELRRKRKGTKALLELWVNSLSKFIAEKPAGRVSIFSFLTYELDNLGSGLTAKSSKPHDFDEAVREFASLTAELHRAGARLISTLVPILEAAGLERAKAADALWGTEGRESVLWNLSLSFWQTICTTQFAVGLLESELSEKQTQFLLDVWYEGTMKS